MRDLSRLYVLGLVLALSACGAGQVEDGGVSLATTHPGDPEAGDEIQLPQLALLPELPGGRDGFATKSVNKSADLMGLTQGETVTSLGVPVFTRRDGPARIWRHEDDRCLVDLFFYPGGDGIFRVHHVEIRGQGVHRPPDATCIAGIKARGKDRG